MKTIHERILDPNDYTAPYLTSKLNCFYCEKENILGISVQDVRGINQHTCFSCLKELIANLYGNG